MSTVTLAEAQRRLGELVHSLPVEGEILITLNERTVARLTRVEPAPRSRGFVVTSEAELESKLAEGVQQLNEGSGISLDVAEAELKERAATRRKS